MAKRIKPSSVLPREIMFQIAQFLPDEASFFAFIQALRGTLSGQGPIDAVWRLGRSALRMDWPNLKLYPMKRHKLELAIQAIPVFAKVMMHAVYDLHRLVDRVTTSTNLVVVHKEKPDLARMHQWFDQLAQLPVRGLVYTPGEHADRMSTVIPHLLNVWPSLTYLRCLKLTVVDQATLESICQCIATSQITELRLQGQKAVNGNTTDGATPIKLEGVVWTHLVAWLHSTRVVRFDLHTFCIVCDDDLSMQTLNGALAASDAMRSIFWCRCAIRISTPLVLPPQLQKLSLVWCTFELEGIECIWKLLPAMPNITYVDVSMPLSPSDVDTLASVLAQSNVSYLNVGGCSIGIGGQFADCIQRLADAFEASAAVRKLILVDNELGVEGMKAVLAAVERRPFVTELVDLSRNCPEYRLVELNDLINTRMSPNTKIIVDQPRLRPPPTCTAHHTAHQHSRHFGLND